MAAKRARELQFAAAFHAMNQRRSCDAYMATFADDLRLILPDGRIFGWRFWQADSEEIMRAGVKIHLNNVMVSGNIVILEADFENPTDDPLHCPPATTQVHFQHDELTHQLNLYFYDSYGLEKLK
jgi:RNA polymerase sigma-70 factor (ECF subfamily)